MKLHRTVSCGLMTAGAIASTKALIKRFIWEDRNIIVSIMLDWDDVHAVATRATGQNRVESVEALLNLYKAGGADYLAIPELTINRLLSKGDLTLEPGADPDKVYVRAKSADLAHLVAAELRARLPHIDAACSSAKKPLISFKGDLPTIAEVGLGFNPADAELARQANLEPAPRPVAFSWMQPEMIERTLSQAAGLGACMVAVQGELIPGHEFNIQTTIDALKRYGLKCAYFSESRHQRGDWHLVKNLTQADLVVPAHEFQPEELLEEDWRTVSERWVNYVTEAGVRLCSVRFFRTIHAADPMESVAYIQTLAQALQEAGLISGHVGAINLTPIHPRQEPAILAGLGLGAAGAAGLAADHLPLADNVKLLGVGAAALGLAGLPFLEEAGRNQSHHHHHHHHHNNGDHHHGHHHNHGPNPATAYASKCIALAAAALYPAAAVAVHNAGPLTALVQALAVGTAGAATLGAATADIDYVLNVEPYRGYNLDWLLPLGLVAASPWLQEYAASRKQRFDLRRLFQRKRQKPVWLWLPLAGLALAALKNFLGGASPDLLASLDREHRHSHTHHLSNFQRLLGDSQMALSPRPLRKWSLLAPLGVIGAGLLRRNGQEDAAAIASTVAAAGLVAALSGYRNARRPLLKTLEGRTKGWLIGVLLGGAVWATTWLLNRK